MVLVACVKTAATVYEFACGVCLEQRLNLTPEQEKMWPAVEAALRKIVYTKNAMSPRVPAAQPDGERMAYIDPTSADVQQLKYAALPLIKRLNDDQRREVKMMAYVMGLAEWGM